MSYLLLKPRSSRGNRTKGLSKYSSSSSSTSQVKTPRSVVTSTPNGNAHSYMKKTNLTYENVIEHGQNQIQNPIRKSVVVTPNQTMVSKSQLQREQKPMESALQLRKEETQGVISMEEVMEDLRILEEQQRESQLLLESVKLTKKLKLDQMSKLETNLSSLKYTNGEQRAKLMRSREVLSVSTRKLGSLKLQSNRAGADLKDFDKKLRKALGSSKDLQLYRRKLESSMTEVRNMTTLLSKIKIKAKHSLQAIELKRDDALHQKEAALNSIKSNKSKSRKLAEEALQLHSSYVGLEHDLSTVQQMESTSKFRVETISKEIADEQERFRSSKDLLDKKISDIKKSKEDCLQQLQDFKKDLDSKKQQLRELWERCVQYQREEGHEPNSLSDGNSPTLDLTRMRKELDELECLFERQHQEKRSHQERIEEMKKKILFNQQKEVENCKAAEEIEKNTALEIEKEQNRQSNFDQLVKNFERQNEAMNKLEKSFIEVLDRRKKFDTNSKEESNSINLDLKNETTKLKEFKNKQSTMFKQLNDEKNDLLRQQERNVELIEEAKKGVEELNESFERAKIAADDIKFDSSDDEKRESETIGQEHAIIRQDLHRELSNLLKKNPFLADLNSTYDVLIPMEENIEKALIELRLSSEHKIQEAHKAAKHALNIKIEAEQEKKRHKELILKKNRDEKTKKKVEVDKLQIEQKRNALAKEAEKQLMQKDQERIVQKESQDAIEDTKRAKLNGEKEIKERGESDDRATKSDPGCEQVESGEKVKKKSKIQTEKAEQVSLSRDDLSGEKIDEENSERQEKTQYTYAVKENSLQQGSTELACKGDSTKSRVNTEETHETCEEMIQEKQKAKEQIAQEKEILRLEIDVPLNIQENKENKEFDETAEIERKKKLRKRLKLKKLLEAKRRAKIRRKLKMKKKLTENQISKNELLSKKSISHEDCVTDIADQIEQNRVLKENETRNQQSKECLNILNGSKLRSGNYKLLGEIAPEAKNTRSKIRSRESLKDKKSFKRNSNEHINSSEKISNERSKGETESHQRLNDNIAGKGKFTSHKRLKLSDIKKSHRHDVVPNAEMTKVSQDTNTTSNHIHDNKLRKMEGKRDLPHNLDPLSNELSSKGRDKARLNLNSMQLVKKSSKDSTSACTKKMSNRSRESSRRDQEVLHNVSGASKIRVLSSSSKLDKKKVCDVKLSSTTRAVHEDETKTSIIPSVEKSSRPKIISVVRRRKRKDKNIKSRNKVSSNTFEDNNIFEFNFA